MVCFVKLVKMLKPFFFADKIEAGCDEAGRGCLAGPVVAAAVILPSKFILTGLNDSKKLSASQRADLEPQIKSQALAWAIAEVSCQEIDRLNILNASFLAMHRAIQSLKIVPEMLLIDGNRFNSYKQIPHQCVIKGDAEYCAIAAASVLAKTARDRLMEQLHKRYPQYGWNSNKGYPTKKHRKAIAEFGSCLQHRNSFTLLP